MNSLLNALWLLVSCVVLFSSLAEATPYSRSSCPDDSGSGDSGSDDHNTSPSSTYLAPSPRWVAYADAWYGSNAPPPAKEINGFNTFILGFFLEDGATDMAKAWTEVSAEQRASVLDEYHSNGISLLVSAFGETEAPTTHGRDPVELAHTIAAWVQKWGLDGVDVDYEDFKAMNSGTGAAEQWLIAFTQTLRDDLPSGQYIITHAPVAPWFTDSTSAYPHGAYYAVNAAVGDAIDWYNIQFYNQGNWYSTCATLLYSSPSGYPHTSVFEINHYAGVPLHKIVIGKPASIDAADGGYMTSTGLAGCLKWAKTKGWNGGAMFWEFPNATASLISNVRSFSWPV